MSKTYGPKRGLGEWIAKFRPKDTDPLATLASAWLNGEAVPASVMHAAVRSAEARRGSTKDKMEKGAMNSLARKLQNMLAVKGDLHRPAAPGRDALQAELESLVRKYPHLLKGGPTPHAVNRRVRELADMLRSPVKTNPRRGGIRRRARTFR